MVDEPLFFAEPDPAGEVPFWALYRLNCIEGPEFTGTEARNIVISGPVQANHPADGHDVSGIDLTVAHPVGQLGIHLGGPR